MDATVSDIFMLYFFQYLKVYTVDALETLQETHILYQNINIGVPVFIVIPASC